MSAEKNEPVGWVSRQTLTRLAEFDGIIYATKFDDAVPLYAAPPQGLKQWQNLTDDEIKKILGPLGSWGPTPVKGYTRKLFDEIEAALREKNA